ncbi:hypothetical protein BJV74DRAFT_795646 [Russula compacta]|nr:hypothetical protein BJV74DRAFT_795646 [Russula compacta]
MHVRGKPMSGTCKAQQAANWVSKKAEKERRDAFWKAFKLQFKANVRAWQVECKTLFAGGTAKKDLPKKPKLPLKETILAAEFKDTDESAESVLEPPQAEVQGGGDSDEEEFEAV